MSVKRETIEDAVFRGSYALLLAFMIGPLIIVILTSFSGTGNLVFPPEGFSLQWYGEFFADASWLKAFDNSLIIGAGTTAVSTVLGTMAAFGLETREGRWTQLLVPVVIMPLLIPPVILGVTLLVYFNEIGLRSSHISIIMAHTLWATPLVFFVMQSIFQGFDWELRDASMDLGANPLRAFFSIVLPNVKAGIMVSALLAFIISLQEFVMALFLSTHQTRTVPVLAWTSLRQSLTPVVSVVSTFLILISFAGILLAVLATNLDFIAKRL